MTLATAVAVVTVNFQPAPVGAKSVSMADASINDWSVLSVPLPAPTLECDEIPASSADETSTDSEEIAGTPSAESEKDGEAEESSPKAQTTPQGLTDQVALLMNLLMLEKSQRTLEQVPHYTATFFKQERIDGELADGQTMELKMRHSPFSVYMKWVTGDKGRQVLYVDGENEGKMLVKFGGWKSRLPSLKLDPNGSLALAESRHPITQAGLLGLVQEVIAYRKLDLERKQGVRCTMVLNQELNDRECHCFTTEYTKPEFSETYRKSVLLIDARTYIPVAMKAYTWPELVESVDENDLDGSTLIEFYSFSNVNLNPQLASSAFDRQNKEYRFR